MQGLWDVPTDVGHLPQKRFGQMIKFSPPNYKSFRTKFKWLEGDQIVWQSSRSYEDSDAAREAWQAVWADMVRAWDGSATMVKLDEVAGRVGLDPAEVIGILQGKGWRGRDGSYEATEAFADMVTRYLVTKAKLDQATRNLDTANDRLSQLEPRAWNCGKHWNRNGRTRSMLSTNTARHMNPWNGYG